MQRLFSYLLIAVFLFPTTVWAHSGPSSGETVLPAQTADVTTVEASANVAETDMTNRMPVKQQLAESTPQQKKQRVDKVISTLLVVFGVILAAGMASVFFFKRKP